MTSNAPLAHSSKGLNIGLWIAQVVLAAMYLMAGVMKSTTPIEQLHATMPWTNLLPELMIRFIGISEFVGALGLLLPALLRIKPTLTPLAALGLTIIQGLAFALHFSQGEMNVLGVNIVFAALSTFIWWGRSKRAIIYPKS